MSADESMITSDTYFPDPTLSQDERVKRANEYTDKRIFGLVDPEGQDPEVRKLIVSCGPRFTRLLKPLRWMSWHDVKEMRKNQPPQQSPHPYTLMSRRQLINELRQKLKEAKMADALARAQAEEEEEEDDDEEKVDNDKDDYHCSKKLKLAQPSSQQQEQGQHPPLYEAQECVATAVTEEEDSDKIGYHCPKKLKLEEPSSQQEEQRQHPPLYEAQESVATAVKEEEEAVEADVTTTSSCG